jgi:hypothetical protein
LEHLSRIPLGINPFEFASVHQQGFGHEIGKREQIPMGFGLVGFNGSLIIRRLEHGDKFILSDYRLIHPAYPKGCQYRASGDSEQFYKRIGKHHKIPQHRNAIERNALRMIHGYGLRHQFANHYGKIRDSGYGETEGDRRFMGG